MVSKFHFLLLVLAFPAFCSCASVGDKFENNEEKSSQGAKRESGNPFERGNVLGEKFQPWDDWINKRGFSLTGADDRFGPMDRNALQGWSDWLAKRTGGSPLAGDILGDQWNTWESGRYAPGFGAGNQFQRWDDFVKRQHPFMPASLNSLGRGNYQSWQDWMKRGDLGALDGYGGLSSNDLLMSWDDLSKLNKRYQWFGAQRHHPIPPPALPFGFQRASPYWSRRSTEETEKVDN